MRLIPVLLIGPLVVACGGGDFRAAAAAAGQADTVPTRTVGAASPALPASDPLSTYWAALPVSEAGGDEFPTHPDFSFWQAYFDAVIRAEGRAEERLQILRRLERTAQDPSPALIQKRQEAQSVLRQLQLTMRPPDVTAILNRPMESNGVPIEVRVVRDANGHGGIATCDGRRPIIQLAAQPPRALHSYAMLFFREHELAHHTLGHISCVTGKTRRTGPPSEELDADCEAARVLALYQNGAVVVDRTWGTFHTMGLGPSKTHPSTIERALHLDNCPEQP
jgi:hypothetical protein